MMFQTGDRVRVALLPRAVPGVVECRYANGFYLVRVAHDVLASVIVGPHRLTRDDSPEEPDTPTG